MSLDECECVVVAGNSFCHHEPITVEITAVDAATPRLQEIMAQAILSVAITPAMLEMQRKANAEVAAILEQLVLPTLPTSTPIRQAIERLPPPPEAPAYRRAINLRGFNQPTQPGRGDQ